MAKFAPPTEQELADVKAARPKSKFAPPSEAELQAIRDERERPGTGEIVARGAAQGLTFNFADEIAGVIGTIGRLGEEKPIREIFTEELEESRKEFKRAEEEGPVLFGGAQVAGGLASLLVPGAAVAKGAGLVGKGAGAAAARAAQAAAKVPAIAKAGIAGATAEVGALETEDEDPAAKRLADVTKAAVTGSLTGVVAQGVFSGISKAIGPRVKETIEKLGPTALRRRAEERAVKAALGQNKKEFMNLMRSGKLHKTGRDLLDADPTTGRPIVRAFKNVEDIAQQAAEAAEVQGKKIGQIVDSFDESFEKSLSAFKKSPAFQDLTTLEKTQAINQVKERFLVSPTRIAERIREKAAALRDNPGEFQLMNRLNKLADEFEGIEPYSLRKAQEVKGAFKWSPLDPTKNQFGQEATNDVRRIVNEEMERVVDQVSSNDFKRFLIDAVGAQKAETSSKILQDYKNAKELYRSYKTAADAAKERALADLSNRFFSPSDTGAGLVGVGAALASGGATAGAIAQGAALSAANKFLRTRGSSAAAVGLDKVANLLGRSPESLGKFGDRLLDALQQQGGAGLAAEHLKLLQDDPDYKLTVDQLLKKLRSE